MYDEYREADFSQKMFTDRLNLVLPVPTLSKNTDHGVETHGLYGKEKIPAQWSLKMVLLTVSLLRHESTHHGWFH